MLTFSRLEFTRFRSLLDWNHHADKINHLQFEPNISLLHDPKFKAMRFRPYFTLSKIHKSSLTVDQSYQAVTGLQNAGITPFVDTLLKHKRLILKTLQTTDFINFIKRRKLKTNTSLASMEVTSLIYKYTNIQNILIEKGIASVYKAYD